MILIPKSGGAPIAHPSRQSRTPSDETPTSRVGKHTGVYAATEAKLEYEVTWKNSRRPSGTSMTSDATIASVVRLDRASEMIAFGLGETAGYLIQQQQPGPQRQRFRQFELLHVEEPQLSSLIAFPLLSIHSVA
jgi:hypothetical protein